MSDARERRRKDRNKYALMGAVGAGLQGWSSWYDRQKAEEAKALREQRLLELKNKEFTLKESELGLARDRMEENTRLAEERNSIMRLNAETTQQQIADLQSRFDSTQKQAGVEKLVDSDIPAWQKRFIGSDANAELKAQAWSQVIKDGALQYSDDEELAQIQMNIESAFGTGPDGKPLISAAELRDGLQELKTKRKARGLTDQDISDGELETLMMSGLVFDFEEMEPTGERVGVDMGEEPGLMTSAADPDSMAEKLRFRSAEGIDDTIKGMGDFLRGYSKDTPVDPAVSEAGFDRGIRQSATGGAGSLKEQAAGLANYPDDVLRQLVPTLPEGLRNELFAIRPDLRGLMQ